MAEFAKEAMKDQTLDADEVVTIQWCESDCFEIDKIKQEELNELKLEQEEKKDKKKQKRGRLPTLEKKRRTIEDYEREMKEIG